MWLGYSRVAGATVIDPPIPNAVSENQKHHNLALWSDLDIDISKHSILSSLVFHSSFTNL